jgi:hypothetical protein
LIADRWNKAIGLDVRYPTDHRTYIERCHNAGQPLPTPLLFQKMFTGSEFVLTEQRPRMQSRVAVVPLRQGDAVIFAVHHCPVQGTRGFYRVQLRHNVSRPQSGHRPTLEVIFHDAK